MTDVYIAEGHGRRPDGSFDPGAKAGEHSEQRDSKPVAEACTQVLRAAGLDVLSESDMADDPNFYGTTARANRAGVKCVVSFHYDWSQAPPGAFMIATTDAGRELGWAIEARVAEAGFDIRDYPDDRDGLYLLDNSKAPAVIFECGRIGHEDIDETHEQRAMGEAAALGILDWLGVSMLEPKVEQFVNDLYDRMAALYPNDPVPTAAGLTTYLIPDVRKNIVTMDELQDIVSSSGTVDEVARKLAKANAAKLARIKEAI